VTNTSGEAYNGTQSIMSLKSFIAQAPGSKAKVMMKKHKKWNPQKCKYMKADFVLSKKWKTF
jgi:hypothetical protein